MAQHYRFHVEDVTCEKCDARIRSALQALPGAQQIVLERTPEDEAIVTFSTNEELSTKQIETAITEQSQGTSHHYLVRWDSIDA